MPVSLSVLMPMSSAQEHMPFEKAPVTDCASRSRILARGAGQVAAQLSIRVRTLSLLVDAVRDLNKHISGHVVLVHLERSLGGLKRREYVKPGGEKEAKQGDKGAQVIFPLCARADTPQGRLVAVRLAAGARARHSEGAAQ